MTAAITLRPVPVEEQSTFTEHMKAAFAEALLRDPDLEMHMEHSLQAPDADILWIERGGEIVGGTIITGAETDRELNFIFVDTPLQGQGIGQAAWKAIEERYAGAQHWELVTSYLEKRNIHFYVNRCGFAITEYFNPHHPDPSIPQSDAELVDKDDPGLFKFEKELDR